MSGELSNEIRLNSPPQDGISAIKFAPNSSQFLLVSSWDSTVRLYDVNANIMRIKYAHSTPVLDCCFQVKIQNINHFYTAYIFILMACNWQFHLCLMLFKCLFKFRMLFILSVEV